MSTELTIKKGRGVPLGADLAEAELAVDLDSGTLYSKLGDGLVHPLNESPDSDNYGHWKLQVDYGTPYQVVSGATANFEGTNGINVTRTGDTITIDGSGLDLNEEADNYQYWQYKINGFSTTSVMSTQVLDFQSGDGIDITKEGFGIKISATGGGIEPGTIAGQTLRWSTADTDWMPTNDLNVDNGVTTAQKLQLGNNAIVVTDADDALKGGFYAANPYPAANFPDAFDSGVGSLFVVQGPNANNITQIAFTQNNSISPYFRNMRSGTWQQWQKFVTEKNDGTVKINGHTTIEVNGASNSALRLENRANAQQLYFKPNGAAYRTDEGGIQIRKNIQPVDETGTPTDGHTNLGTSSFRFNNGWFAGLLTSTGEIRAQDPSTTNPVTLVQQGALGKLVNGANGDMEVGAENTGSVHLVAGDGSRKVTVDKEGRTGIGGTPGNMMVEYFEALERTGQLEEDADLIENMDARAVNPTTAILQVNGTSYFKDEMASVSSLTTNMGLGSETVLAGNKFYRTGAGMAGINLASGQILPTDNTGTNSNATVGLGSNGSRFNQAFFAGNVRIGSTNADDIQISGAGGNIWKNGMSGLRMVAAGIVPITGDGTTGVVAHNAYDIGTSSRSWKDGHFGGTVYATKFVGDGSGLTNLPGGSGGGGTYTAGDGIDINNTTGEIKLDGTYPGTFEATEFVGGGAGLTGVTATDSRITNLQIQNWDAAHGWGNHADAGYAVGNLADYVDRSTNQSVAGQKNFTQELTARRVKISDTATIYAANHCGLHFSTTQDGTPMVLGTLGDGTITTGDGLNLGRTSTRFNKAFLNEVDASTGIYSGSVTAKNLVTTTDTTDTFLYATSPIGPTLFRHVDRGLEIDPMSNRLIVGGVIEADSFITDENSDELLCANGTTVSKDSITGTQYKAGQGIGLTLDTFSVAANNGLSQDANGLRMSGSYTGNFSATGTITGTDCIATSDERLKDNIATAPVGIIDQLNGREWEWKESGNKGSGVVAQELEEVLPHLVHTNDQGMKSVSYMGLCGYLIEEIKALKAEVEALRNG